MHFMKSIKATVPILFGLLALIVLSPVAGLPAQDRAVVITGKRIALVIGNSSYKTSPLKNPANDAQDMADRLRRLGFEVIQKKNAGRRAMIKAISDFGSKLGPGSVGLFYYAGHGMQVKGTNYLIPVDADVEVESDVVAEAVDLGVVISHMEDARNDLNIVILDACRDNPFGRGFRSSARGLARMDAPRGTIIAYATAPGSVAADGRGRNGTFTKHLLKQIESPGLSAVSLLQRVASSVAEDTADRQQPWLALSPLKGDFYFRSTGKAAAGTPAPAAAGTDYEAESQSLQAEKERLRQERDLMEQKKALEEEKQRLEEARKKLAYAPAAEPASEGGYVRTINGKVTGVRFFESGFNIPEQKDRTYRKNFSRTQTRFVNWEVFFEYPAPGRRIDFKIEAIWYNNGAEIWRHDYDTYALPDWTSSWSSRGYGWKEASASTWKAGSYRVDFFVEGEKIGNGTFTIY
jgi:uncharacterized caspase-like protein